MEEISHLTAASLLVFEQQRSVEDNVLKSRLNLNELQSVIKTESSSLLELQEYEATTRKGEYTLQVKLMALDRDINLINNDVDLLLTDRLNLTLSMETLLRQLEAQRLLIDMWNSKLSKNQRLCDLANTVKTLQQRLNECYTSGNSPEKLSILFDIAEVTDDCNQLEMKCESLRQIASENWSDESVLQ